ncbi:MAG: ribosomal protein S18 acetylase RimI-like enzyme [Patiriisocius sp.]|jgi:ribosomal protein S18 acetylase RimI-like enzyme
MLYTVRKATPEDMPSVLELIKELAVFEKEPYAVEISVNTLKEEGFGENPLFTCFVAEDATNIIGMALVYFRFSTWKGRTIHLEDLIVKESKRGLGIGKALYTEVMHFANLKGVKRVEFVVLDWNTTAVGFYKSTGATLLKDWYLVQMNEQGLRAYLKKEIRNRKIN